jgi:hypothetical protein
MCSGNRQVLHACGHVASVDYLGQRASQIPGAGQAKSSGVGVDGRHDIVEDIVNE